MNEPDRKTPPRHEPKAGDKPGFFARLFRRMDDSLKRKAAEKSAGGCCCDGDDKGGKCC